MKIVVVSDTHMPRMAKKLPSRLVEDLQDADFIIHAGDWQTMDLYYELSAYADVAGVTGNVDGWDMVERFKEKEMIELKGFKIGVTHGHGTKLTTEKRALAAFEEENVDCIIFGHSHIPVKKYENGILLFNPGSPTDKRRQDRYSHGIIRIDGGLSAEHVYYESKE